MAVVRDSATNAQNDNTVTLSSCAKSQSIQYLGWNFSLAPTGKIQQKMTQQNKKRVKRKFKQLQYNYSQGESIEKIGQSVKSLYSHYSKGDTYNFMHGLLQETKYNRANNTTDLGKTNKYGVAANGWWLRSPGNNPENAGNVNSDDGNVNPNNNDVSDSGNLSARPAQLIKLETVRMCNQSVRSNEQGSFIRRNYCANTSAVPFDGGNTLLDGCLLNPPEEFLSKPAFLSLQQKTNQQKEKL
jgi:hypothetical protein